MFEVSGYQLETSEISAAFGLVQLEKLVNFREIRQKNFLNLLEFFGDYKFFTLPKQKLEVDTAWLAFPLTIKRKPIA